MAAAPSSSSSGTTRDASELMPGWLPLAHEEYDGLPCYYHASTRVVSWCEPYAVDLTQVTKHEPPSTLQHEQEPLVDLLSAHHVREWDALREASPSGATAGSAAGLGQPRNERDKEGHEREKKGK